jgi:GntR family transcriptional regulator
MKRDVIVSEEAGGACFRAGAAVLTILLERIGGLTGDAHAPLYLRLQRALRQAIEKRILAPNDLLPAEREIAQAFKISRITVRKAMEALAQEGLVIRRHGSGTFVADPQDASTSKLSSFSDEMLSRGLQPSSEWISRTDGAVTPAESLTLGLSPGAPVYRFQRVRCADGMPVAVEYSTIPAFALPGPDAVDTSLYSALQAAGYRPVRALQRLRAMTFPAEQAALLNVPERHCGLMIERRGFLRDGRSVEVTQSYYRGDTYDFVAELTALNRSP